MSVKFSGTIRRSGGILSAIRKELNAVNLKAVKRINVSFDPFAENVKSTRDFLFYLSTPKVVNTNPNCALKTDIICDRKSPSVVFTLIPGVQEKAKLKQIKLNSENLSTLELIQLCNKYVTALAPKEEPLNVVKTKSEKKSAGKGGKRK